MDLSEFRRIQTRRRFLEGSAGGLGMVAFWHVLASEGRTADAPLVSSAAKPKPPHFASRAKNVIFLFMAGAPSQLDLYDPKPDMRRWHGQPVPDSMMRDVKDHLIKSTARVMASPRTFQRYGNCGMEVPITCRTQPLAPTTSA
jgi:hypothetical protein